MGAFTAITQALSQAARAAAAAAVLLLAFGSPVPVWGTSAFGQASDLFNIGAGARSMGMGSAFTAVADDASAPYFNPAGLAFQDEHQLMGMHAPLYMDTSYNYLATVHPFGDRWGAVALSDALLMSGGYDKRDTSNNLIGQDEALRHNVVIGSYARKIQPALSVGMNAKLLQQRIAGYSGSALGVDVGALYSPMPLLRIGLSLANVNTPRITLSETADTFQPMTRLGVASEVFANRLLLSADAVRVSGQKMHYTVGTELTINPLFQLRAGYNENRDYTFGMGMKINAISIDYAFSHTDLGAFNKVSFAWAWHNIYQTDLAPPTRGGRSVHALEAFDNRVVFVPSVPDHVVARWSLAITNSDGVPVRTLRSDLRPPEEIVWDARNTHGEPLPDGRYSYRFVVHYKNGKSWDLSGDLRLDLPRRLEGEIIEMTLDVNGANAGEEHVR